MYTCEIHEFGKFCNCYHNNGVTFFCQMIVQLIGSIVGAALCLGIGKSLKEAVFQPPSDINDAWRGFGLEIILTFVLMITIFGTAIKPQHFGKKEEGLGSVGGLIAAFPIAFALGAGKLDDRTFLYIC